MMTLLRIPVRRRQVILLVVDGLLAFLMLPASVLLRNAGAPSELAPFGLTTIPAILLEYLRYYTGATTITAGLALLMFFIFDLYDPGRWRFSLRGFLHVAAACAAALLGASAIFYILPSWRLGRGILVIQFALLMPAAFLARVLCSAWPGTLARRPRVLLAGGGSPARLLIDELERTFRTEYEFVGLIEQDLSIQPRAAQGDRTGLETVKRAVSESKADILVFALPKEHGPIDPEILRGILELKTSGVEVWEMPTWFKTITGRVPVEVIEETWLLFNPEFSVTRSGPIQRARRAADVLMALVSLGLLLPVILLIALAIKLTSRGPVFYSQERLGLNRRPYRMIKFRSMVADAEGDDGPVWSSGKGDQRVTALGRLLRRSRLDEVPNFINVLRGEMSVVGPRPERQHFVEQLEREIPCYGLRFAVRPGMTGWAQVNYSYGASIEDARRKLQYELYYILERSALLDAIILLKTAQTVLLRPGS